MIFKSFTVIGVLTLLSAVAHAGSAPKELYGKSITVQWSETRIQRSETEKDTRNFGQAIRMHLYISTAGRPFVQTLSVGTGGVDWRRGGGVPVAGHFAETGPDVSSTKNERVDFEGRTIIVYRQFPSGARRVVVEFDGAPTNCKASVTYGKEGGKNEAWNSGLGRVEVFSIQVSGVNCSIQGGNVFGQ
jgi:hypothetical protein